MDPPLALTLVPLTFSLSCPPRTAAIAAVEIEVQRLKAFAIRASAAASGRTGLKAPRSV